MSVDHVEKGPPKKKTTNSQIQNPKRQYMLKAPKIEFARLADCTESFPQPLYPYWGGYTCIIKTIGFLEPKWSDTGNSEGIIRPSKKNKVVQNIQRPEIYSWRTGAWELEEELSVWGAGLTFASAFARSFRQKGPIYRSV